MLDLGELELFQKVILYISHLFFFFKRKEPLFNKELQRKEK